MPKLKPKPQFNSLLSLYERFPDEASCRKYLEEQRWDGKPICPHCEHDKVYRFNDGKLFKCAKCRKQFTVRVGTIFEDSALPLRKWFLAIYLISAHKKGIASIQLAKDIRVTQKTAWFMLHRIRYAMQTKEFNEELKGIVEIDETYVGGKVRHLGRGTVGKTPVFGMVERKGTVRSFPVNSTNSTTLMKLIRDNIDSKAVVMSDNYPVYNKLNREYEHYIIDHSKYYTRGIIHTQTIEGVWSLLKRGIVGIYHWVSPKHLHRYCNEFDYRYNLRDLSDPGKFTYVLSKSKGKLQYKELIK